MHATFSCNFACFDIASYFSEHSKVANSSQLSAEFEFFYLDSKTSSVITGTMKSLPRTSILIIPKFMLHATLVLLFLALDFY